MLRVVLASALLGACKQAAHEQDAAADAVAVPVGSLSVGSAASLAASGAPPSAAPWSDQVKVPSEVQDTCHKLCDRSTQLACKHADECLANCYAMASLTPCSKEINALFPCLLREPAEHWECSDDGVAAIRTGYCDEEQKAAVACMEKKMRP